MLPDLHAMATPARTDQLRHETELSGTGGHHDLWACRANPELWFSQEPEEVETAKRLCHTCPVRRRCLASALSREEPWGVWGGELFDQGRVIPRKRPRGRPRKEERAA